MDDFILVGLRFGIFNAIRTHGVNGMRHPLLPRIIRGYKESP
jgi:hypothetical protein